MALWWTIVTEPPHVLLPVQLARAPRFPSTPAPEIVTASLAMFTSPPPAFSSCNVAPLATTVPSTDEPSEFAWRPTRKPECNDVTPGGGLRPSKYVPENPDPSNVSPAEPATVEVIVPKTKFAVTVGGAGPHVSVLPPLGE